MIEVIVSDLGGVLTTPLADSFAHFQEHSGIQTSEIGAAVAAVTEERGINPVHELEVGALTELEFLEILGAAVGRVCDRHVDLSEFSEVYWSALVHNDAMIDWMRSAKARGLRLALLTNNVREWEPRWRPRWPIDELFELVVDSGFVGRRKPDAAIYELTTELLECEPARCVLVDDMEVNCDGARALGWAAVQFRDTAQTIAELEELLGQV
jgi:putative hydrolase of the HAD superfamily